MSNTEKTLRDKYFANDIFRIGEMVEDINTNEQMLILDRGSNYVTVATKTGIIKKWLNDISESKSTTEIPVVEEIPMVNEVTAKEIPTTPDKNIDFIVTESGQLSIFGFETKNFDIELSDLVVEQFSEFTDLYSKHQIIKCLDLALTEVDCSRAYTLLEKVESFYDKNEIHIPFVVEVLKNDLERKRLVEIIAAISEVTPEKSNYLTISKSIAALKTKYTTRKQWEILWPFFKLAQDSGLMGITHSLPFKFDTPDVVLKESIELNNCDIIIQTLEENLDLLVDDLDYQDIENTFDESEFVDEELTPEMRNKLSRIMNQHSTVLAVKRERAMSKSASTSVLAGRARRLAIAMIKKRIFKKSPDDMTRQEKERFESGSSKRKLLIAKLAQRLMGKVRMLQSSRLHHTQTSQSNIPNHNTSSVGAS